MSPYPIRVGGKLMTVAEFRERIAALVGMPTRVKGPCVRTKRDKGFYPETDNNKQKEQGK